MAIRRDQWERVIPDESGVNIQFSENLFEGEEQSNYHSVLKKLKERLKGDMGKQPSIRPVSGFNLDWEERKSFVTNIFEKVFTQLIVSQFADILNTQRGIRKVNGKVEPVAKFFPQHVYKFIRTLCCLHGKGCTPSVFYENYLDVHNIPKDILTYERF